MLAAPLAMGRYLPFFTCPPNPHHGLACLLQHLVWDWEPPEDVGTGRPRNIYNAFLALKPGSKLLQAAVDAIVMNTEEVRALAQRSPTEQRDLTSILAELDSERCCSVGFPLVTLPSVLSLPFPRLSTCRASTAKRSWTRLAHACWRGCCGRNHC